MTRENKSKDIKNFYAITNGRKCGIFKHWSQVKPLVDKYPGGAYKGHATLNKAISFMIKGGFAMKDIIVYDDSNTVNATDGESVTDFANRNGTDIALENVESTNVKSTNAESANAGSTNAGSTNAGSTNAESTNVECTNVESTNHDDMQADSDTEEKFIDAPEEMVHLVYIDGCVNNGNTNGQIKAGIGVYWGPNHELNVSEPILHGKKTNNVAELQSAIKALQQIKDNNYRNVIVRSNSKYVTEGITSGITGWKENNWMKNDGTMVENKDLWLQLDAFNTEMKPKWQHIGRELNAHADKLSRDGANADDTSTPSSERQCISACVICNQDAVREVLTCSNCGEKVHFKCSGLPYYQIAMFRKSQRKFTCEICVIKTGNINASDARKSCGGPAEDDQTPAGTVLHSAQSENLPVQVHCCDEIKSIKEDVSNLKVSLGNFESEILKIVSQLCEENIQMRERECEEKCLAVEKEKQQLLLQIQKYDNRENEVKIQLDNLRDKNAKLGAECENLRENIARRKDTVAEMNVQISEKDRTIGELNAKLSQIETEKRESNTSNNDAAWERESEPIERIAQSNIPVSNRFEPPATQPANSIPERRPDVVYVKGHREPLSNFYRMKFRWGRREYHSVEQAFQHEKALRHRDRDNASRILDSKHAGIANKIGRDIWLHLDWDHDREGIMFDILREKARQSKEFCDQLVQSGERDIVADVFDKFWGAGKDGKGRNILGKMLMEIRREIRKAEVKPNVAIIGSSLLRNMRSDKFCRDFNTDKRTAYTIPQASQTVRKIGASDVIVYQLLSNDMKTETEDDCVNQMRDLVILTREVQPGAKIIISLPPNRGDSEEWNNKTNIINARVKSLFSGVDNVFICDNSNLSYRGEKSDRFIDSDGVHPNPAGNMLLFANIRQAVKKVLSRGRMTGIN